jgi:hypothetical protein
VVVERREGHRGDRRDHLDGRAVVVSRGAERGELGVGHRAVPLHDRAGEVEERLLPGIGGPAPARVEGAVGMHARTRGDPGVRRDAVAAVALLGGVEHHQLLLGLGDGAAGGDRAHEGDEGREDLGIGGDPLVDVDGRGGEDAGGVAGGILRFDECESWHGAAVEARPARGVSGSGAYFPHCQKWRTAP